MGTISGPFPYPPPEGFRISPLGAFRKNEKVRVIHDLSFPPGDAVNEGIDDTETSVKYSSVADAVKWCQMYPDPWLAKCDLKSAYTSCMVKPADRHLLGFSWTYLDKKCTFTQNSLPFGLSSSCARFETIATVMEEIMICRGAPKSTLHYLDDTIVINSSKEACADSLAIILDTCKQAGFRVQDKKTCGPTKVIEFLGITIDTIQGKLCISSDKVAELRSLLTRWLHKKSATKRELLSLLGKLAFASQVVVSGVKFTRRLTNLSKLVKNLNHRVTLTQEAKKDLKWWYCCLIGHNGVSYFPRELHIDTCEIMHSDASDIACGAVYRDKWTILEYQGPYEHAKSKLIAYREMLALVLAVATFGPLVKNKQVLMNVDNETVRLSIIKGYSREDDLMALIRSLYFYASIYHLDYRVIRVTSAENISADAISRKDWHRLYQHQPTLDQLPMTHPLLMLDF